MVKKRVVVRKAKKAHSQLSLLDVIEEEKYTEEQKEFVNYNGDLSIILAATAGAGKTYSCVQRLKELLKRGVDPSKIIFFSFTKAATEELQHRIGSSDIKITTIHAFCLGILAKVGKFKNIATFYDFIQWFQDKYKPKHGATSEEKTFYYDTIGTLYEDADYLSSSIAAFKLQTADGVKSLVPSYISEYNKFLRESKSRDFSDMLIEVRDLLREDKWLKMFRGQYDYIFVDEYQDTSTIQLQIFLTLSTIT
jgi:DNA helicase-2/ATP-dependent DNA helicase PcrA